MSENNARSVIEHPESMNKMEEPWTNWRSLAGMIYLFICIMDFVIMPIAIQIDYAHTKSEIKELIVKEEDHKFVIDIIDRVKVEQWSPVTLAGAGLFHMAFGAILTGAAVTKGLERKEAVKSGK